MIDHEEQKQREYIPTKKSTSKHEVPTWYHDAKLGIFIHWGLYSVPAFAVITDKNFAEIVQEDGPSAQFKANPYAEWYLNSLRIEGTATQRYHEEHYGNDFDYDDFVPMFNAEIKKWDPSTMVSLFKDAGARYVVLVTKHHDGFLLWKSAHQNPRKPGYQSRRDIVGELTGAVREAGLKMGFYYSGVLDWTFNPEPIVSIGTMVRSGTDSNEYIDYANAHWRELIDMHEPDILWNDIGYPAGTNIYEIFAYYYNKIPEGVINDRWTQYPKSIKRALKSKLVERIVAWFVKQYIKKHGAVNPTPGIHCDFVTPEYASYSTTKEKKWESTRGIGHSFGYNRMEKEQDYMQPDEAIRMLVDIVSKNGNLLLNVGPRADGSIPPEQERVLRALGKWLEINGDAIQGTRPWKYAEGIALTSTGTSIPVRFTSKGPDVFVQLMDAEPNGKSIAVSPNPGTSMLAVDHVTYLARPDVDIAWKISPEAIELMLPATLVPSPVHVFKIHAKQ